jgi:hypothetical protein
VLESREVLRSRGREVWCSAAYPMLHMWKSVRVEKWKGGRVEQIDR